jgi:hypothetical protein
MPLTASAIEQRMTELSRELASEGQHLRLVVVGGAALTITAALCGGPSYMANDIDIMADPRGVLETTIVAQNGQLNDEAVKADTTNGLRAVVGRARQMGELKHWLSLPTWTSSSLLARLCGLRC